MIYTNYIHGINESLTTNKETPNDFYIDAKEIVSDIAKKIEKLPAYLMSSISGIVRLTANGILKDDKKFKQSLDKSITIINNMKSRKTKLFSNPYKFNTNLNIRNLSTSIKPDQIAAILYEVLRSNGFMLMKDSKKITLKNLFVEKAFYKPLSDKSLIVVYLSVNYNVTDYGTLSGYTSIPIYFRAVKNDEKSLRHLNIIESAIESIDNISII